MTASSPEPSSKLVSSAWTRRAIEGIHKLFGEWDKDGSRAQSERAYGRAQLRSAIAALRKHLQARQRLTDVFRLWDEDGDRELTKQEFGKAMASCGLNCDERNWRRCSTRLTRIGRKDQLS